MELILQDGLEHQQIPVEAVANVFDKVDINTPERFYENPTVNINDHMIYENISRQQANLKINHTIRGFQKATSCLNIDIKMETGTGKTFVYARTMLELHKRYGINKFIIAVPSLTIKAGSKQFIDDDYVRHFFRDTCGYGTDLELSVLNAMKVKRGKRYFPSVVRTFVEGSSQDKNRVYVLLTNIQLLTSAKMLSRSDYDFGVQGFYRPFDALRATKPFVIIDEPHRFSQEQAAYKTIINELHPQCVIRYGATFPYITTGKGKNKVTKHDYMNLLYDLNACEAFNRNLIKGVAKEHFDPDSSKNEKIKITSIVSRTSATFTHITTTGNKTYNLQSGDSLSIISNELAGLSVSAVGKNFVELSNGQEKKTGEEFSVDIYSSSYQEQMIRLALQRHFETERHNFERDAKIKTLALFFIDDIESFRGDENGKGAWLCECFDRLLKERMEEELAKDNSDEYNDYLKASLNDIPACRAGYFSRDNNDNDEAVAAEVDDILHKKKVLLSFKKANGSFNTRRFLFSKWTLKEGWDNPNVFTITKLRSSGSENSKLQEVGRGLRLPVDEYGNRISNEEFMLNYIVDFNEADFASKLVEQINGDMPVAVMKFIPAEELQYVAERRGIDQMELMMDLYKKKYITDVKGTVNQNRLEEFMNEYPEFNQYGVNRTKIVDRNKKIKNTIKVRKAQFNELKELWAAINRKYIIFFDNEVNTLIKEDFTKMLSDGIFAYQTITSQRSAVKANSDSMSVVGETGVTYIVKSRVLPYNVFLKRLNSATSIPIMAIHQSMCSLIKESKNFDNSYINADSLSRIISRFNDWKIEHLQGRFRYKQTNYDSKSTALTNSDGSMKEDIVQGLIGINMEKGVVSDKYLYDAKAYDSPLELKNINTEISEVIVYGKIPRRSIAIPTIADSTYSPDFMYVVKRTNGQKELNIIVETKDVEGKSVLRGEEGMKISCAEMFFKQLKIDGYDVHFRTQINNKEMATIIGELITADAK
jgi:type III restriction enzyme